MTNGILWLVGTRTNEGVFGSNKAVSGCALPPQFKWSNAGIDFEWLFELGRL